MRAHGISRRSFLALAGASALSGVTSCVGLGRSGGSSGKAPIVIGYSAWPGWWPWAIGEKKGLFEANGVKVELRWYDNYLQSVKDLAAGRIDGNAQTVSDTLAFAGQAGGIDQSIVLINDISVGNDKVVARAGINSLRELRGRKVAVEPGVVDDFLLTRALVKAGLTRDDVNIVALETSRGEQAFIDGQVDAFCAFPPFWSRGLAVPGARELTSSAQFPWTIWDVLAVDRMLVESRADDVQAVVNSWVDILDYMTLERDDAFALIAERAGVDVSDQGALVDFLKLQDGTQIYSLDDMRRAFSAGTAPDRLATSVQEQVAFLVDNEFVKEIPEPLALLEPRFVRNARER